MKNKMDQSAFFKAAEAINRMSRKERDRLWPGMHKDLKPLVEVLHEAVQDKSETADGRLPDRDRMGSQRAGSLGRQIWKAYAPPGAWGPKVTIGSIWGRQETKGSEKVSFRTTAQIKSAFQVRVMWDSQAKIVDATASGSLTIEQDANSVARVSVQCRSFGTGQVIDGEYTGPGM